MAEKLSERLVQRLNRSDWSERGGRRVIYDDSLPGFADALGAGVGALQLIGSVVLVGVGVALPFVPLVAVATFVIIWTRRHRARREVEPADAASVTET